MTTKRRSARDVTIRLGDMFDDKTLPADLDKAINVTTSMLLQLNDQERAWHIGKLKQLAEAVLAQAYVALLNEQLAQDRDPGGGPKGPRLPEGVTFADLLPHLAEGRRILTANRFKFMAWVESNPWPGGMKVGDTTVRNWLTRYAKFIDAYDRRKMDQIKLEVL